MATKPKDKPDTLSPEDNLRRENFELKRQLIERSLNDFAREHASFWDCLAAKYGFTLGQDEIAPDGTINRKEKQG